MFVHYASNSPSKASAWSNSPTEHELTDLSGGRSKDTLFGSFKKIPLNEIIGTNTRESAGGATVAFMHSTLKWKDGSLQAWKDSRIEG